MGWEVDFLCGGLFCFFIFYFGFDEDVGNKDLKGGFFWFVDNGFGEWA